MAVNERIAARINTHLLRVIDRPSHPPRTTAPCLASFLAHDCGALHSSLQTYSDSDGSCTSTGRQLADHCPAATWPATAGSTGGSAALPHLLSCRWWRHRQHPAALLPVEGVASVLQPWHPLCHGLLCPASSPTRTARKALLSGPLAGCLALFPCATSSIATAACSAFLSSRRRFPAQHPRDGPAAAAAAAAF